MNSFTVIVIVGSLWGLVLGNDNPPDCSGVTSEIYYPSKDCSKFWQCSGGEAISQSCPSGLHFNENTKSCDWPANVTCRNGDDNNNEDDTDKDDNHDDNNAHVQCENVECPPEDGDKVIHKPGPECSKFCKCSGGIAYLQNCPKGLYYNAKLEVCDYPEQSGCSENNQNEENNNGNNNNDNSNEDSNENNNENNSNNNDNDNNTEENNRPEICPNADCPLVDGDVVVHRRGPDCSKFCKCSEGIGYLQHCPKGLYYNAKLEVCDYPANSGCVENP